MITGEIKGQVDRIWDAFWSGGISNPLEVIEQITYLLFMVNKSRFEGIALMWPPEPLLDRFAAMIQKAGNLQMHQGAA